MPGMTLKAGDHAPDFTATSDDGQKVHLGALRGRWVVLFFFPRANSAGCSVEAQRFEQALPELEKLGATVIGVSADTEAAQAKFRLTCQLSYPLIPDGTRQICRSYGVWGGLSALLGIPGRHTFLIDPAGRIARHYAHANPLGHMKFALDALREVRSVGQPQDVRRIPESSS